MRSILPPRFLAVAVLIAVALASTVFVNRSRPSNAQPSPSLQEAARRTIAAGSARLTGTVSAPDGTAVTFEGLTSFETAEGEIRAWSAGAGDKSAIEVRITDTGTWLRTPAIDRWIAVPMERGGGTEGLPTGWGEILRRLSRHGAPSDRTDFDVDDHGRIRWLRFSDAGGGVEVSFRDFGVTITVDPPPSANP